MIRVTRRYRFSASHRLHSGRLSESENRAIYGKCNNPHGHGHDYVLEVSARGPLDESTGRLLSLEALDRLVNDDVLRVFHLKNINEQVTELTGTVPTTENLMRDIRARLSRHWRSAFPGEWPELEKVRLQETKRNSFELLVKPS